MHSYWVITSISSIFTLICKRIICIEPMYSIVNCSSYIHFNQILDYILWLTMYSFSSLYILTGIKKLDKERNQCIGDKTQNTVKEIKQYQKKWLQHVQRMDTNRLPKQVLQYKPKGRRNIGRPRKRWRDQLHLEGQGTGNTPKPSGTWWWWWLWWCCTLWPEDDPAKGPKHVVSLIIKLTYK